MTDFRFQILGANDPESKNFENVFQDSAMGHQHMFRDQLWWKSAVVKLPKGRLVYRTKKLMLRGTRPSLHFAPILPKMGRLRPKNYLNVATP